MKSLVDHLSSYADYHRDQRNVKTHFVGIPLIVLGIAGFLSRPTFVALGVPLSPVVVVVALCALFYVSLDVRFGLVMTALFGGAAVFGTYLARQSTTTWLAVAGALFVVGWAFQFVGHAAFEKRKPAFLDDLIGLLVGPLFIVAEVAFALGLRSDVRARVERRGSV